MIVLLDNDSVGQVWHALHGTDIGACVLVKLHDENGNTIYQTGTIKEILEND